MATYIWEALEYFVDEISVTERVEYMYGGLYKMTDINF